MKLLSHKNRSAMLVIVEDRGTKQHWMRFINDGCVSWFKKTRTTWSWPAQSTQKKMEKMYSEQKPDV